MKFWAIDSPVMRVLGRLGDIIILNMIFVAGCIPVLTIGTSLSALYTVAMKMARGEDPSVWKEFWKAYKRNFKPATICWLIMAVIAILLFVDFRLIGVLNKRGHHVTVFEREDRVGGLLMYGIPNMKLEKTVVQRRVDMMQEEGVEFRTSVDVGKDISAEQLLKEYDAVILACGSSNPRNINADGRDADGIYYAVDFLKATTKSLINSNLSDGYYISAKYKNVIVIGGGDTGNDCVGTAIRHGCKSVVQLEMMPKLPDTRAESNPWPEWPRVCKTDYGQEEAIAVFGHDPRIYQTTVKRFIKDDKNHVRAVETIKLQSVHDPKTGRMRMEEIEGSEQILDADLVLIAAGFLGAQAYVTDAFGVETTPRTNVSTKIGHYSTSVEKVFTAGDTPRLIYGSQFL